MFRKIIFIGVLLAAAAFGFGKSSRDAYRLRPEDLLRVQVYGKPELQTDAPIAVDGSFTAAFLDPIQAEGKTVKELIAELAKLYAEKVRLRDPLVSVVIVRFREMKATVGGFVQRPSTYVIRPGDTILSLLNQGGGAVPDRADLRKATLKRRGSRELIPVDLYSVLYRNDTSQAYEVFDGDELNIPEGQNLSIKVQGKVASPGVYPYREPMTLADAISTARGEVVGRSRLSQTLIIRERTGQPGQYTYIRANYVNYIRSGDVTQNIVLQAGDLVWVPETNTPDFQQINAIANVAFILDRFGGALFGINIFSR
jgi:protein involved in polysaccharide export with SLBB domain